MIPAQRYDIPYDVTTLRDVLVANKSGRPKAA
jgi:hypothetical protein